MMFLLAQNIPLDTFKVRRTDCKSSVALLPAKHSFPDLLMHLCGRISFQVPQKIVKPMRRLQTYEQVNMIFYSPNG